MRRAIGVVLLIVGLAATANAQLSSLTACASVPNASPPCAEGTGAVSRNLEYSNGPASAVAYATAVDIGPSTIGRLGAFASADGGYGGPNTVVSSASASYSGVFLFAIEDPTFIDTYQNNAIGLSVSLSFRYEGNLAASGNGFWSSASRMSIRAGLGNAREEREATRGSSSGLSNPESGDFTLYNWLVRFSPSADPGANYISYMTPVFMTLSVGAVADNNPCRLGQSDLACAPGSGSSGASAGYGNTFGIVGAMVQDEAGHAVPFRLFDGEGHDLSAVFAATAPTTAPEPGTLVLLSGGLTLLSLPRTWRRLRTRSVGRR